MDGAGSIVLVRVNWGAVGHDLDRESRRFGVVLLDVVVLHGDAVLVDRGERGGVVLQGNGGGTHEPSRDRRVDWSWKLRELLLLWLRNHRFL